MLQALFAGNQRLQHELGSHPPRTRVIPNGVRVDELLPLADQRHPATRPQRIGFVGRVVPIKDVKMLLRAFAEVSQRLPDVELWIVGPTDENVDYADECLKLARALRLARVTFTGVKDIRRVYPEIDLLVLTSLSEGQPLVILEAACAGVPTVTTDVGDCRALVEGRSSADRALGPSGIVTRMGDAHATAQAIVRILGNETMRASMSRAGRERASRFYRESMVIDRYRELYRALASGTALPSMEQTGPLARDARDDRTAA
jgi:glycosyltransferase involved in cell wall biosynthesis